MADAITGFISDYGYGALVALMLLENVFPPIPSELIMPFAGYVAARGDLHPAGAVAAGSVGSLLGALAWYGVGHWVGIERLKRFARRHGRWLTLSPDEVDQAQRWFVVMAALPSALAVLSRPCAASSRSSRGCAHAPRSLHLVVNDRNDRMVGVAGHTGLSARNTVFNGRAMAQSAVDHDYRDCARRLCVPLESSLT